MADDLIKHEPRRSTVDSLKIPENKQILKSGVWLTACSFITSAINFLTTFLFTRLMTPAEYGEVAAYTSTVAILVVFVSLQLRSSISRAYLDMKEEMGKYMSSLVGLTFLLNIGSFLLAVGLVRTGIWKVNHFLVPVIFASCLANPIIQMYLACEKFQFRYKLPVVITIGNLLCNVGLGVTGILLFPQNKAYAKILGSVIPEVLIGLALAGVLIYKGKTLFNLKYWKYALSFGIPSTFHIAGSQILIQADRLMINSLCGSHDAGVYSVPYNVSMIIFILWESAFSTISPWLFRTLEEKNYKLVYRNIKYAVKGIFFLAYNFMFFSPFVMKIMVSEAYYESIGLMPVIAVGIAYGCINNPMIALEQFNKKVIYTPIGTLSASVINIIMNYLLIRKFGYAAAAYTTAACYFLQLVFHTVICKLTFRKKVYPYAYMHWAGMLCIVSAVVFIVLEKAVIWRTVFYFAGMAGFALCNREMLKELYQMFCAKRKEKSKKMK